MTAKQVNNEKIKQYIIDTMNTQKPETLKQLITTVQQTYPLPEQQITSFLIELENENKINLTKKEASTAYVNPEAYLLSSNSTWYWITIALTLATMAAIFTIPENAYPIVYIRSALAVVFILFLPGYAFIKALFPSQILKTSSENLDTIARIALSFGISLALVPIVGLILNYTPWGIRLLPTTLSLTALTITFATAAILREYYNKKNALYSL